MNNTQKKESHTEFAENESTQNVTQRTKRSETRQIQNSKGRTRSNSFTTVPIRFLFAIKRLWCSNKQVAPTQRRKVRAFLDGLVCTFRYSQSRQRNDLMFLFR